jgi:isopenicillin-N N-acyltransferase-like protein
MQVEAGQIGRQGVNSRGIALNANGLGGRFGKGPGIPQPYIRRRILDSVGMYDALRAIFKAKQCGCTNLLLTHRDGFIIDLETTPGRHGWMYPTDGILVHGNHFIAFIPPQLADNYRPWGVDSLYRVPRIEQVLRGAGDATSPQAMRNLIASALRDHFGHPTSVCCHPDDRFEPYEQYETIASSIVDLTDGHYYIALGRPCETEYQRLPRNIYED